ALAWARGELDPVEAALWDEAEALPDEAGAWRFFGIRAGAAVVEVLDRITPVLTGRASGGGEAGR
ncbi:MAG: hypothetical protein ACRDY1_11700, partial [Acidimicrobiales bacterium]